jgi:flavin-dependent dehydrogenase
MHYRVAPWSEHMELYWGRDCQIYVTPAASDEVCVAVISRNPHLRLEDALPQLPDLRARLAGASNISIERGAITTTSKLARVEQGSIALVGDASGSVDAITGEGLCLAFRQALALADGMAAGSLAEYQARHRRLGRRARFMSHAMLALDGRSWLCDPVLRLMSARPVIFRKLLALHVGAKLPSHFTGVPACVQET